MKTAIILLVFSALIFYSCDSSTDSVVGSSEDTAVPNLIFKVDSTYVDGANKRLVAKGMVTNNGSSNVNSPWKVEAQFYTDGTKKIKLGGNSTQIGVPLSKNQSTFWTVYFSSANVTVTDYPNFMVGDLRGIY